MTEARETRDRDPESLIPLPRLAFQVLIALAGGENHGYGIAKEVELNTHGRTKPGTGSLYLSLSRLEEQGLIEESPEPHDVERDDARRKYYRITEFGRDVARAEGNRLVGIVGLARRAELVDDRALTGLKAGGSGEPGG